MRAGSDAAPRPARLLRVLRAALLAGVVFATPALAGPSEDAAQAAATVQSLLDADRPADGEALARAALAAAEATLGAASAEAGNLNRLVGDSLFNQKRHAEAEPFFRAALAIREAVLGHDDADTAVSANDLAVVLRQLGRYAEAEPFARQTLAIRDRVLGPDHRDTARAAYWLARTVDALGRTGEAAGLMIDAVTRGRAAMGQDDPAVIGWMGEAAAMMHDAGDPDAEAAYRAAIAAGERVLGPGDTRLAYARQGLAVLLRAAGRPAEAAPLFRQALAAREAAFGPDHPATVASLDGLARALWSLDEVDEAGEAFRRLLAAREKADGPRSAAVADALRWAGRAAARRNRLAEAETLYKRALDTSEQVLGPEHVLTGFDLIALGQLYSGQQRLREAEPLLRRAVAVLSAAEETRRSAAVARVALAGLVRARGDVAGAIALAQRSLAEISELAGPRSRDTADLTLTLASLTADSGDLAGAERLIEAARGIYGEADPAGQGLLRAGRELGHIRLEQGRPAEALPLFRESLHALEARYGPDSDELLSTLASLGSAEFALGRPAAAAAAFERNAAIVERLAAVDAAAAFATRTGEVEDQAVARAAVFDWLVKSWHRVAAADPARAGALSAGAFRAAQRVIESRAAGAMAQTAARQAAGEGELAGLARERQDLVGAWRRADEALTLALGAAPGARDEARIAALRSERAAAEARLAAIDAQLATAFPQFAALEKPAPLDFAAVQARLRADEVLLFYADTGGLADAPPETFLWAVAATGAPRWVKLARGADEIGAAVRHLREQMGVGPVTRGAARLGGPPQSDRQSETLRAASELHKVLLDPVADMIAGKALVVVPSRRLAGLPFQLLVAELPAAGAADAYREARWLVRDHAVTVLPSVAALAATAAAPAADAARTPYLGFANPLLTGASGEDRRAFARSGCGNAAPPPGPVPVASAEMPPLDTLFRGAAADVEAVRRLAPLPETVDEACAIAATLGAGPETVVQGAAATEAAIAGLSADGALAAARIVHFATHGLVSGELSGLVEPAIVLTPPQAATPVDDGLLTASEVGALRLDADWVILSACNTASGDGGGEALSGLARSFFYAGARTLMVSHWPVNSDAAVRLATGAVAAVAADPAMSRAEALRRAMLAEIDRGGPAAEPSNWAPFVVVGR